MRGAAFSVDRAEVAIEPVECRCDIGVRWHGTGFEDDVALPIGGHTDQAKQRTLRDLEGYAKS